MDEESTAGNGGAGGAGGAGTAVEEAPPPPAINRFMGSTLGTAMGLVGIGLSVLLSIILIAVVARTSLCSLQTSRLPLLTTSRVWWVTLQAVCTRAGGR